MEGVAAGLGEMEDEDFQPTEKEILEYAQFLGMDV
jgi:hypothetical protein